MPLSGVRPTRQLYLTGGKAGERLRGAQSQTDLGQGRARTRARARDVVPWMSSHRAVGKGGGGSHSLVRILGGLAALELHFPKLSTTKGQTYTAFT